MNLEPILIAGSSFTTMLLLFGRRATPAAVWAGILAWMWPDIALACGGITLAGFLFLEFRKRRSALIRNNGGLNDKDVIDAEFAVVESSEEPKRWTRCG